MVSRKGEKSRNPSTAELATELLLSLCLKTACQQESSDLIILGAFTISYLMKCYQLHMTAAPVSSHLFSNIKP